MATSSSSGSKAAWVVPMAASTRPQFGSLPNSAHLSRLLRAIARPTSTASSSLAAPVTSIATSLVAPSASASSWAARSAHTAARRRRRSRPASGVCPEAPAASRATVSLVDMQPSASSRSKVVPGRRRSDSVGGRGVDDGVGGDHAQHRRQRRVRACRRPWPCRRPSSRRGWVTTAVLATVSVVRIASAASAPPSASSAATAAVDAGEQLVHRQPVADQAGRADDHLAGPDRPSGGCGNVLGGARGCRRSRPGRCRRSRRRS